MPSVRGHSSLSHQCFLVSWHDVKDTNAWEEERRAVLPSPKQSCSLVTCWDVAWDQPSVPEARDAAMVGKAREEPRRISLIPHVEMLGVQQHQVSFPPQDSCRHLDSLLKQQAKHPESCLDMLLIKCYQAHI